MARDAMDQQHATGNQIGVLDIQVQNMGAKLRTVQSLAGQTYRDASEAYNSAINIYQQAKSLQVPSVDEENIEKQATRVQDEARRIKMEAERLIESNEELLTETQDRRKELEDLMERAEKQQQDLDAQLADMDGHRAKALKAVSDGNAVLSDAERTLQTLNDFENTVNANREAARKALEDVSKIEDIIEQAATRTTEAREAMQGADNNANLALSVAKDAEQIAIDASGKAGIIKEKAAESRESAAELSSATNSLTDKLSETKDRLAAKEEIAANDGESAHNALEKANQAQQKAKEAAMKVERAKKELEEIAAILATVQEPEPGLLEELQTRVEAAEQKFKAAELDDHLSEFEVARQRQKEQMRLLQDELENMQLELSSLSEIERTLPRECWNTIRLEP